MADSFPLLDAIRRAAKPGLWSAGVALAKADAVALESKSDTELVLRVKARGKTVPFSVVLSPADECWECDCPGRFDPCEHVVAAAVALSTVRSQGAELASSEGRWARVAYHFARVEGGLALRRTLALTDGTERPLDSLTAVLHSPAEAAKVQVEQFDLRAERLLERPVRAALPQERLEALLKALEGAPTVLLDGAPVAVSSEPLLPRVRVEDDGPNVVVTVERDPKVTEVLSAGVVLCGDTIHRLGETAFAGVSLQLLPQVKTYNASNLGELSGRVLPELARRFAVVVRSSRVPPIDRTLTPRIQLELTQFEGGLSVLPTLVYGAPPHVRVDNGKLFFLQGSVPLRDEALERRLVSEVREKLDVLPGRRTVVSGAELPRFVDKLSRWRGDVVGTGAGAATSSAVRLVPDLRVEGQASLDGVTRMRLALDFRVESAAPGVASVLGAEAVLRAYDEGLGLVPLDGGGWAPLPKAWLDENAHRVAELLASRDERGQLANHALPQLAQLCEALNAPAPANLEGLRRHLEGFEHIEEAQLPQDLTAQLRPYQREGVNWLAFLQRAGVGGVLADDMGLGKTLQAVCVLGPKSLVVCPTSVLPNWVAEMRRFRPSLTLCVYHGPGRALDDTAHVTVTTYALLRLDAAALQAKNWKSIVLDEAQFIKNPESQVARAAFGLSADFRLALSGTPVENRLDELWSVMHFTNRGLLLGRREFGERFATPIAEGRPGAAEGLRRRIRPFVLRRLKRDVAADLPPKSEAVLPIELDERERDVYQAVLAATRSEVVSLLQGGGSVLRALEALLRLRQAACHSALVPGQRARTSSKVQALLEALRSAAADGHKALVFSQWTSLLDLIEPELRSAGIEFLRLDGSTADRGAVTARFEASDGPPVMLISLKAGGTGLNLTSADHVFLVDPWWNPAVEAQAADRAHRIGQTRPVLVYRLVAQGTVEEKILKLQDKKRALFEAALGDASASGALTREDLLGLFE